MPKVSIVVPVYNVMPYLVDTMKSLTEQTMQDIEIIAVDDCSSDDSYQQLTAWADQDARIQVIRHETNSSTLQARKTGVLAATGEYLMFVDGDDELLPEACERAYAAIVEAQVDMVEFGREMINVGGFSEERFNTEWNRLAMPSGPVSNKELIERTFIEYTMGMELWRSIAKAALWKKVCNCIGLAYVTVADDVLLKFILFFFLRSYHGRQDLVLYRYYFGRGFWGQETTKWSSFIKNTHFIAVLDELKQFLMQQGAWDLQRFYWQGVQTYLLDSIFYQWNHLSCDDQDEGLSFIFGLWDASTCIEGCRKMCNDAPQQIATMLSFSVFQRKIFQPIRVIGAFYYDMTNDYAQRELTHSIRLWVSIGYQVVLFTNEAPQEGDCAFPSAGITHVILPDCNSKNYENRFYTLQNAMGKYRIDLMIWYASLDRTSAIWDAICVKQYGIPFVLYMHHDFLEFLSLNSLAESWEYNWGLQAALARWYDGLLVSSQEDAAFWQPLARRVFQVKRPSVDQTENASVSSGEETMAWRTFIKEVACNDMLAKQPMREEESGIYKALAMRAVAISHARKQAEQAKVDQLVQIQELQLQLEGVLGSRTFRLGKALLRIPRALCNIAGSWKKSSRENS